MSHWRQASSFGVGCQSRPAIVPRFGAHGKPRGAKVCVLKFIEFNQNRRTEAIPTTRPTWRPRVIPGLPFSSDSLLACRRVQLNIVKASATPMKSTWKAMNAMRTFVILAVNPFNPPEAFAGATSRGPHRERSAGFGGRFSLLAQLWGVADQLRPSRSAQHPREQPFVFIPSTLARAVWPRSEVRDT